MQLEKVEANPASFFLIGLEAEHMNIKNLILKEHYIHKNEVPDYKRRIEVEKTVMLNTESKHTQADFKNNIKTEEDLLQLLGREWLKKLELLISFIDEYKHIFGRQELISLPISCKNKNLINIFKNEKQVSRMLKLAQDVDLLLCTDSSYQFNGYDEIFNNCKKYICNKEVQDLIIKTANKYGIVIRKFKNFQRIELKNTTPLTNVAINSKLNLRVANMTDDEVLFYLNKRYPQLPHYQQLADEINENFYSKDKERRISFIPHITRSRGNSSTITKIGIRATNSLVSLKEHENGKESNKLWRKDWLKEHYGQYIGFDVKSSIFRINYFLNFGEWLPNDIDLYEKMFGESFEAGQREEYKALAMSLYFEKSVGTLYTHVINKTASLRMYDADLIRSSLEELHKKMFEVIGDGYDSEIFLHESCIYMELQKELLRRGHDVTVIYDGFYVEAYTTEEEFSRECCDILKKVALNYKKKFIK